MFMSSVQTWPVVETTDSNCEERRTHTKRAKLKTSKINDSVYRLRHRRDVEEKRHEITPNLNRHLTTTQEQYRNIRRHEEKNDFRFRKDLMEMMISHETTKVRSRVKREIRKVMIAKAMSLYTTTASAALENNAQIEPSRKERNTF